MLTKDYSKTNFTIEKPTWELVKIGCLQRIADACELMASNYTTLQSDRDLYKRWYYEKVGQLNQRDRTIANLRGQITKLKKKGCTA